MEPYRYSSLVRSAEYKLTPDGVDVTSRDFGRLSHTFVPFDKIPIHSSMINTSSKWLAWPAGAGAVALVVITTAVFAESRDESIPVAIWACLLLAVFVAYFMTRTTSEVFTFEGQYLAILRRSSENPRLVAFIEELQQRKLDFFRQRISRRSTEFPPEEIARYLIYLRECDLIDETGYTDLRRYFENLAANRPSLGFQ